MNKKYQSLRVVVLGGGTGLSTMLKGLKRYTSHLTAVVTVSDNGGSSGILREEMGINPPGDIRNCLVALANTETMMKKVLQYRFKEGALQGQNLGNLFLAALTDISGSFEKAVKITEKVLAITGKVLPVTLDNVDLCAAFQDGVTITGETQIIAYAKRNAALIDSVNLIPEKPIPVKEVITSLKKADIIIMGPGSLYTSIIPNLLVESLPETIRKSKAKKFYIANIMTQPGETIGFTIEDHVNILEKYIGENVIDTVIVNTDDVPPEYLKYYEEEGASPLYFNTNDTLWDRVSRIEAPLMQLDKDKKYVRHNSEKLAECIFHCIS